MRHIILTIAAIALPGCSDTEFSSSKNSTKKYDDTNEPPIEVADAQPDIPKDKGNFGTGKDSV